MRTSSRERATAGGAAPFSGLLLSEAACDRLYVGVEPSFVRVLERLDETHRPF